MDRRCGSYRCGKCPQIGFSYYSYSFLEEQKLDMIVSGLKYNEKSKQTDIQARRILKVNVIIVDLFILIMGHGQVILRNHGILDKNSAFSWMKQAINTLKDRKKKE